MPTMARNRDLPRLNINPTLAMQQPGQVMFSPALPTSLQQGFHPPMPLQSATMGSFFPPGPPRPTHRANQASIQLAAAGIHPPPPTINFTGPPVGPMTPMGGHFPRPSTSGHPFPNRNRRQLSIGGPPKAVLGGPARKLSPLQVPPGSTTTPAAGSSLLPLKKKVVVNLPKEIIPSEEEGKPPKKADFARTPLPKLEGELEVVWPEVISVEEFPLEQWRRYIPDMIDVFLPGAHTWDVLKQQAMEQKLARLGVERGTASGSNVPHIHAPHARAASISSPADPALLLFKLNKLQQAQAASAGNSLSTSPQPPFMSPSPNLQQQQRPGHGHSMSLAHPPGGGALNPFGPNAVLGFDQRSPAPAEPPVIHAPQGRVPAVLGGGNNAPPLSAVGGAPEKIDFVRGFGLDIPEESEEEVEEAERETVDDAEAEDEEREGSASDQENDEEEETGDGLLTVGHSRHHSRLSAALSLRSFGGLVADGLKESVPDVEPIRGLSRRDELVEGVEEWTGSEDVHMENGEADSSDDESIGEWSNPSDEERARQERAERRLRKKLGTNNLEKPRRIPNFPRPPDNTRIYHPIRQEDDIISNPSEEEQLNARNVFLGVTVGGRSPGSRPLPPLPHSRATSGQHSLYDPAHAHSRRPSDISRQGGSIGGGFVLPEPKHLSGSTTETGTGGGGLNPFAKPFVFGAKPVVAPAAPVETTEHMRTISKGKGLNAAAMEFKPGGFTFTFPNPAAPSFPVPETRPLPVPPEYESPFQAQGREKRQKTEDAENEEVEEGDTMSSFKFPVAQPAAPSFLEPEPAKPATPPLSFLEDNTAKAEFGDSRMADFSFPITTPSPVKQKRAPIPLDFKHPPVSSNTVPAGLFKALVNGSEERTRRSVRSRLSSHEIFPSLAERKPSLDDMDVQGISLGRKVSRQRLVTDPGHVVSPTDDVFGPTPARNMHARRRSSLPENLDLPSIHKKEEDGSEETMSESSIGATQNLTTRLEMHHLEHTLDKILDEKIRDLKKDISTSTAVGGGNKLSPETEAMITEVVSLFRTQLHDSAARGLDDSQADARGELDFELIKDVVEQGHAEVLELLRKELNDLIPRISLAQASGGMDITPSLERYSARTIQAVVEAISDLSARLESISFAAPARERDTIIDGVVGALTPAIASINPETVDYDYLTEKLAQAVKPHISQLIDLASDKRETAALIVERLLPIFPSLVPSAIDTDALSLQLTTEVRRAIAPIDAFEIKEQVADLVVERLDSRLAVRDKAFNVETISERVNEGVGRLLEPVREFGSTLENLSEGQKSLVARQTDLTDAHKKVVDTVAELIPKILAATEALKVEQQNIVPPPQVPAVEVKPDENVLHIKSAVDDLTTGQQAISQHTNQLLSLHQGIAQKLSALPDSFTAATQVLQSAHADFALSRDTYKRELDDLRKSNTEYQVQCAKARGAHGQVRVEKDMLGEKLNIVEADRDRLKAQIKESQAAAQTKDTEVSAMQARNAELEEALAKALARLQASDVASQGQQDRMAELEQANRDLVAERQTMKAKADSLDLQVTFAHRDKEAAEKALAALQKQYDHLSSQESHWEDLRRTAEQVNVLTNLVNNADKQELKELRRIRDRSKILEGEHSALQKRFKDQETKMANNEKATATARNSLNQAQERAAEWERCAKEAEDQFALTKIKMDELEESQKRLDNDLGLAQMQLEEKDAHERLTKDRENKLRDTVAALESKVTLLQGELERAVLAARTPATAASGASKMTNGGSNSARPDSRASTTHGHTRRSSQNTVNGGAVTPPTKGAWDSMHNPLNRQNSSFSSNAASSVTGIHAPTGRYPSHLSRANTSASPYQRSVIPSPTPSVVSVAPTVDADGWWS